MIKLANHEYGDDDSPVIWYNNGPYLTEVKYFDDYTIFKEIKPVFNYASFIGDMSIKIDV